MARMDPAAQKKLQKDINKLKEQEKKHLEEILELEKQNLTIGDELWDQATKRAEAAGEEREKKEGILKTVKSIDSFEKSHAKALSTSTKLTRGLVDEKIEAAAYDELQKNESLEYNASIEAIIAKRQKLIGLSGEDAMLAFDYKETMDEIDLLLEDQSNFTEDQKLALKDQRDYTDNIAQGLDKQAGVTKVMAQGQEGLLGSLGSSKESIQGAYRGMLQLNKAFWANPATVIAAAALALVGAIISAVKYAGELRDELGVSMKQSLGMMMSLKTSALALKVMGLDAKEVGGALLTSFGTLETLTNAAIIQAGLINYQFGATHESVAGLAKILSDQVGGTLSQNLDMISDFGTQFEAAGIAAGAAIDDLATNAEFLADYLDGSAQSMIDATIGARKLGLELGTVAKIADSLLEFETSIASTMQASLLIGKQLNFDRARGLALEGKTNEAVEDIVSQLGGVAEFQALNVVQRRGLAESLGVGTDELSALVRGEPIELDQDSELVTSNKNLIQAINNNTIAAGHEDLINKTKKQDEMLKEAKETRGVLMYMADETKKGSTATVKGWSRVE